jgi:hypothetical protein
MAVVAGVLVSPSWLADRWPDVAVALGLVVLTLAGSTSALPGWSVPGWLALAATATVGAAAVRNAAARAAEGGIGSPRRSRLAGASWWLVPIALAVVLAPLVARLARSLTNGRDRADRRFSSRPGPVARGDGDDGIVDQVRSGLARISSGLARLLGGGGGAGSGQGRGGADPVPPQPSHGGSWWPGLLLALAVVIAVAALVWWLWRRRRRRAGAAWDQAMVHDLERLGRRLGRPRQPSETVERYAGSLAHVSGVPGLAGVGPVLSRSLFGPVPLADDERRQVASAIRDARRARRRARRSSRPGTAAGAGTSSG